MRLGVAECSVSLQCLHARAEALNGQPGHQVYHPPSIRYILVLTKGNVTCRRNLKDPGDLAGNYFTPQKPGLNLGSDQTLVSLSIFQFTFESILV